jgi:immune inhibitor A
MKKSKSCCIMPPSPELEDKIIRSKRQFVEGQPLPRSATADLLDFRTFSLITTRPPKTRADSFTSPTRDKAPVLGTRRALVLLVDFSDKAAAQSKAHYDELLFSAGTYAYGSMRDFYREASYSQLDVIGEVSGTGGPTSGWYRAPQPKSYYTDGNFGFNAYPKNAQKLAVDVIQMAAPHVNFAQYDNDGDGVVDALVIICAGTGGEASGNVNDIWSHKWSVPTQTYDGVQIQTYFMAPEDGRVGVMAHELGHLLMHYPDLYDTDYSSAGTGRWDLMAGGSWNNGGNTPAHPSAWCKVKSGWVNPTVIFNAQQNVTIQPYATNGQVYEVPIGSAASKEYYLVSNRQKTGFDAHLPGEGMMIEHIDDNKTNNTDEDHYLVNIEQCDGREDLNKNANRGDGTDPFPCGTKNEFAFSTSPSSKAYDGSDSKVAVTNIQRSGNQITAIIKGGDVTVAAKWHNNVIVTSVYASNDSQNAWVYLQGLGWRKIKTGTPDGITNMLVLFSEALANNNNVDVYADDTSVSRATLR